MKRKGSFTMATWEETLQHFRRVTDKLGKKIDPGILETVVAFNMLGIATLQSCEGHIGWGVPYPWISIESDMEQKYRLYQYLTEFYAHRTASFDCMLSCNTAKFRLCSQGAALSEVRTEDEQHEKLLLYQNEMAAFTCFLKEQIPMLV
jgi:hypothetical protein